MYVAIHLTIRHSGAARRIAKSKAGHGMPGIYDTCGSTRTWLEQRAIQQLVPTHFANGLGIVLIEPRLDPRVYTFVNEDAHSMSWRLATSNTAITCSWEMDGYRARNASTVSPPSRKSMRLCTGTRVLRKQAHRSCARNRPKPPRPKLLSAPQS
jgi:hypothetical protein